MELNSDRPKLYELQMLRALAASLVVIDHATAQVITWAGSPSWIGGFGWFLGEQGVAIFFVISGFIMSFTSRGFGSIAGAKRFILHRIARVVPLYWFFTLIAAALIASGVWLKGRSIGVNELLMSLGFIPYGRAPMRPILGQGWTLEYEMAFYVIFAASMVFSKRTGHALIAIALILCVGIGYVLFGSATGDNGSTAAAYLLSPYLLLFLSGVAAGHFRIHVESSRPYLFTICIIALEIVIFIAIRPDFASVIWRCIFWSLDILVVLLCLNGLTATASRRSIKIVENLGDASYSLYLSHIFFVYAAAKIWRVIIGETAPAAYIGAALAVSCIAALLLHRYVERPLYERFREVIDGGRNQSAVVSSA